MFVTLLVTIPQSFIWAYIKPILILLHQDKNIAAQAQLFARYMIPSLSANGLLRCLVKFLQTQNIVFPMVLSTGLTSLAHVLLCWTFVIKLGLGIKGAAIATCISNWLSMVMLALYVWFSPSCKKTWVGFSWECFHDIPHFLRLAFPSAVMVWYDIFFAEPNFLPYNIHGL